MTPLNFWGWNLNPQKRFNSGLRHEWSINRAMQLRKPPWSRALWVKSADPRWSLALHIRLCHRLLCKCKHTHTHAARIEWATFCSPVHKANIKQSLIIRRFTLEPWANSGVSVYAQQASEHVFWNPQVVIKDEMRRVLHMRVPPALARESRWLFIDAVMWHGKTSALREIRTWRGGGDCALFHTLGLTFCPVAMRTVIFWSIKRFRDENFTSLNEVN